MGGVAGSMSMTVLELIPSCSFFGNWGSYKNRGIWHDEWRNTSMCVIEFGVLE